MIHCDGGYTTNVPVEDLVDGKAMIATQYDGQPLAPAHGGPARLLVPHLYFWKSAKWVRRLRFIEATSPASGKSRLSHLRRSVARAALCRRLTRCGAAAPAWRIAEVGAVIDETPRVRSLVLDVPDWPGHRAGQHVDIRLTGEDGYQAQRSYSIASPPEAPQIELTVERLEDGEVSPYLAGDVRVGESSSCAGRSAAISSGRPRSAGRCCWSPAARASCR